MAANHKCGIEDRICEDNDDTCEIVRETLEISVKHVDMMKTTHFQNIAP